MAVTRHAERKVVPFAPRQIFDLVADVPRYPEFLPWCTAARVRRREGPNAEIDELAIGFGPFHEKFVSRVLMTPDDPQGMRIETVGIEATLDRSGQNLIPEERNAEGRTLRALYEDQTGKTLPAHLRCRTDDPPPPA